MVSYPKKYIPGKNCGSHLGFASQIVQPIRSISIQIVLNWFSRQIPNDSHIFFSHPVTYISLNSFYMKPLRPMPSHFCHILFQLQLLYELFNRKLFNHEHYFPTMTKLQNSGPGLNVEVEQSRIEMSFLLLCSTPGFSTPRFNPVFSDMSASIRIFLSTGLKLEVQ